MTKISAVVLVVCVFLIVSLTYTHFYNRDLENPIDIQETTIDSDGQTVVTSGAEQQTNYSAIEFFVDMFVFSVPDVPFFFSVIWWILLVILGVAVFLIIRGGGN